MIHANDNAAVTYGSLCSGIEAPAVAWNGLGFAAQFFAEIASFPARVLAHHYPTVPNLGDMTSINGADWRGKLDVLVAGTPCQSFSKAGNQAGLDDPRGQLALKFVEIANDCDPQFIVWENVKNVLSVDGGKPFGRLLADLAGEEVTLQPPGHRWSNAGYVLGPCRIVAWRLLDAQHSGLAARRERVYVVACSHGGGHDPRDILFERQPRGGHPATRPPAPRCGEGGPAITFNGDTTVKSQGDLVGTLRADSGSGGFWGAYWQGVVFRLDSQVREKLMGFPQGYTAIPGARESERCGALGNSMAAPDLRWLGEQIKASILRQRATTGTVEARNLAQSNQWHGSKTVSL